MGSARSREHCCDALHNSHKISSGAQANLRVMHHNLPGCFRLPLAAQDGIQTELRLCLDANRTHVLLRNCLQIAEAHETSEK